MGSIFLIVLFLLAGDVCAQSFSANQQLESVAALLGKMESEAAKRPPPTAAEKLAANADMWKLDPKDMRSQDEIAAGVKKTTESLRRGLAEHVDLVKIPRAELTSKLAYAAGPAGKNKAEAARLVHKELANMIAVREQALKTMTDPKHRKAVEGAVDFLKSLELADATRDAVAFKRMTNVLDSSTHTLKKVPELVFGFRGTAQARDLLPDAVIALNLKKSRRLDESIAFVKAVRSKFPGIPNKHLTMTGHSLGGWLAEGVHNSFLGSRAVTLHAGAPALFRNGGVVRAWAKVDKAKLDKVYQANNFVEPRITRAFRDGDLVSGSIKNGRARHVRYEAASWNPLKNHVIGDGAQVGRTLNINRKLHLGTASAWAERMIGEKAGFGALTDSMVNEAAQRQRKLPSFKNVGKQAKAASKAVAATKAFRLAKAVLLNPVDIAFMAHHTVQLVKGKQACRNKMEKEGVYDHELCRKHRYGDIILGTGTTQSIADSYNDHMANCKDDGKKWCRTRIVGKVGKAIGRGAKSAGKAIHSAAKKCHASGVHGCSKMIVKGAAKTAKSVALFTKNLGVAAWEGVKDSGNYLKDSVVGGLKHLRRCHWFSSERAQCKKEEAERERNLAKAKAMKAAAIRRHEEQRAKERRAKRAKQQQ